MRKDTRERVLSLLKSVNRKGMDTVINTLDEKGYFDARCYGHHKYKGGMADHALEVYDYMKAKASSSIPEDSLVIMALFHDYGKAAGGRKYKPKGDHPVRSALLLDECGLELTEGERFAITHHHRKDLSFFTHEYRHWLSCGDMYSTGNYKREKQKASRR